MDLPDPEGPMMATYSPLLDGDVHALEGMNLFRAHDVGLPEVVGLDDWHFFGSRLQALGFRRWGRDLACWQAPRTVYGGPTARVPGLTQRL